MCWRQIANMSYSSTVAHLRYIIRQAENCDLKPFLFIYACTCAKSAWPYNHVSSLREGKKISYQPLPYLGPHSPRSPKLCTWGRNVQCGYINICLQMCVWERMESYGDAEQVWHMGSQHPSSLCPQRSNPARKKQNKVTYENKPLLRICTNAP